MGPSSPLHLVSLILILAAIHGGHATGEVQFTLARVAQNTEGGKVFSEKIGTGSNVHELMSSITTEIWGSVFGQSGAVWEKVHKISLFIEELGVDSSYRDLEDDHAYEIHLGSDHIEKYKGIASKEIKMMLTYEIAHVLQYTGGGKIPIALMNGIAAYVVIKLKREPGRWVKYGEGDIWDQSLDVTGQFLYYCSKTYDGFVEQLNKKMETSYDKKYFKEITGSKTLDQLWTDYKNKHRPYFR